MSGGRITCPRCGSNNFDTVTACWKCGTPLGGAAPAPTAYPPAAASPAHSPSAVDRFAGFPATAAATVAGAAINPGTANRAAIWLGLLFPYFGIPIGLAFMMCDDRRRQEVGRACILWSLLSCVFHFFLMILSLIGMREYFAMALNTLKSQAGRAGGLGGIEGGGM